MSRRSQRQKELRRVQEPCSAPWRVHFFQRHPDDDPMRVAPGRDFLERCPVAARMAAVLKAVADAPPNAELGPEEGRGAPATLLRAIGAHRSGRVVEALLRVVSDGRGDDAAVAVEVLLGRRPDPDLLERTRTAAERNANLRLTEAVRAELRGTGRGR